jgi:hypothetical protein
MSAGSALAAMGSGDCGGWATCGRAIEEVGVDGDDFCSISEIGIDEDGFRRRSA